MKAKRFLSSIESPGNPNLKEQKSHKGIIAWIHMNQEI